MMPLTVPQMISPLIVAMLIITGCSLFKEPHRQEFSAILIGGAGAAYLNGGPGVWEFGFCAAVTCLAYFGLWGARPKPRSAAAQRLNALTEPC